MQTKIFRLAIIIIFFCCFFNVKAQPYVFNSSATKDFAKGKLYVIMSKNNGENNDYIDVFKKYWKYCPYEIIEEQDVWDLMQEGNYFMQFILSGFINKNIKMEDDVEYKKMTKYGMTFQLSIFTPNATYFKTLKEKPEKLKDMSLNEIASFVGRIKFKPDDAKIFNVLSPFKTDFMGKGYMLTAGPGILKNYLQFFQTALEEKKYWEERTDNFNIKEIKRLKNNTLYIPEELLKGYAHKSDKKEKTEKEDEYNMDEIAKKAEYPGTWQVVTMDKLNELILNSKEEFFYISLYSGLDMNVAINIMTVTNGLTGEIIYKESNSTTKSFSPSLFKSLTKLILK
ncbi:MAG: hypothetical protein NTZ33_00485 [Bacteroidetes bacterium]|nr:hypothetical protein [Bacteroidota bacterium]